MAYSVFRVPNSITILPTTGNQIVSTIIAGSGQSVDLEQWQSFTGSVLARIDNAGNFSGVAVSGTNGNFTGNLTVLGNTVLGDAVGDTITVSGTPTFVQNATFSGDIAVNGGDITTTSGTFNFLPSNATTVNLGASSTVTNIGTSAGTVNVGVLSASGTINANGGTIATNQATASLFNATATSVSAFGAATTLNIATGTMTSGVINIATNNTSGTITLGTSSTNTIIQGNLTVNGTTTTVNSTTVATNDLNFNLGSNVAGASGSLLDGGGITLGSGASVKTFNYVNANTAWTSSENLDILTGKTYKIAGTDVLSSSTLGAGVTISSLQRVGTIATGVWNGTVIGTGYTTAQVTSVTAGATNTISVTGTVQAPFINLATVAQSTGSGFVKITLDAYGRVTGNTTVASGDIPNLSAAQITAGTLAVAQGGTNLSSYTTGDLLYASAATTINKLAAVASGAFLVSNGVSTSPFYRTLVTADITGALGYTPASAASGITGTGTANKIAYWTSSNGIAADADLSYDATNNILSLGTANINTPTSDITVSQSLVNLDAFLTSSYRSAKYLVQTKSAYNSGYQVSEALLIHDGTTAYVTEYGQIYTSGSSPLITLSATVTAGSAVLQAISSSTGNLVRFYRTALNV